MRALRQAAHGNNMFQCDWLTCAPPIPRDFAMFPRKIAAISTPKIEKFDAASVEFRLLKYFHAFSKPAHDETRRAQSRNANLWDAQVAAQHQTRAIGEFWAEN